jgi:E3 SUMO-protein ligase NSE2
MPLPANLQVQPLEAPLNDKAKQALQALNTRYQKETSMQQKLKESTKILIETTGNLNDRAHDRRTKYERRLKKLKERGEEENDEDREEIEEFQRRADQLTRNMDLAMRRIIDNRVWAEDLPNTVSSVNVNAIAASNRAAARPQPQNEEDEDGNDTSLTAAIDRTETPASLLETALDKQTTNWTSKSLTERYAEDDAYASFHKTLWDAKHPEENAPPMPSLELMLGREENEGDASMSEAQDADLAIASERVSLKCPLTLQYFRDPVTASTCGHSFDNSAILNMLKTSEHALPLTPAQLQELSTLRNQERVRRENQMKVKKVRCPVCNTFLQEKDLKPNPVLLRRVQRKLEQERLEAERREREEAGEEDSDDEDEMQGPRGTQRLPVGVGSSPAAESRVKREQERIKRERLSGASGLPSGTQRTTAEGATVVDLDDEDDDDEASEEDEENDEEEDDE